MNFLHSWALGIGGAALLLPFIIHWLTKPRPKSMPLSTFRFVRDAVKQRQARNRLRDILVLFFRGLAIVMLALAFAQPLFHSTPTPVSQESARINRVVILDISQSMSATDSGVDGFQMARVQAGRYLKSESGLKANLILAGVTSTSVFEQTSTNMKVLMDALGKSSSQPESISVQDALDLASKMLVSQDDETEQELVIVSDFQRSNWATVDFSVLPESTKIQLESTAATETLPNLAILSVGFTERPTAGIPALLEIVVGNYSNSGKTAKVEFSLGENVITLQKACPPNQKTTLQQEVTLGTVGWQTGWAKLLENEDAMPVDDRFPFVVQSIQSPSCGILTRQSSRQKPSSTYFLERALKPYADSDRAGSLVLERIKTSRFSLENAAKHQLLLVDHPGKLQPSQIKSMASLIRRGRGVLYLSSEAVDATNLKLLANELGGDFQPPIELSPPPAGNRRENLTLQSVEQSRPPFRVFGDTLAAQIVSLNLSGGLSTRRIPDSLDDDILATLSDQSVLLFTSPVGLGSLSVLNVDLESSNWPRHRTFVPFISELVDSLLRSKNRGQLAWCGEPLLRLLPSDVNSLEDLSVVPTDAWKSSNAEKETDFGEFKTSGDGVVWNWRKPSGPKLFEVQQADKTVFALATNLSGEESDLRTLPADLLTDRLSGGRNIEFSRVANEKQKQDRNWIWFAVAAVIALVGEMCVLKMFRS